MKVTQLILNGYKPAMPTNGRYSSELLKEKFDFYNEFISIKQNPRKSNNLIFVDFMINVKCNLYNSPIILNIIE